MPVTPTKTLQDTLFPKRLGRMSLDQFTKEASAYGLTARQAMNLEWTDPQGHTWSVLSRLGYLHTVSTATPRNESLLSLALEHHDAQGMDRQTHSGEPDLLWAWLGYSTLNLTSDALVQDMITAFVAVWHPNRHEAASGCGVPGDGGWVDTALGMLESLTLREGATPRMERCISSWMRENLLRLHSGATEWQHHWYGLGRFDPPDIDVRQDPRLPQPPGARMNRALPPALPEHFNTVWVRLLRLVTLRARQAAVMPAITTFPSLLSKTSPDPQLIHFLNGQAVGAMEEHLRATILERPDQNPHGSAIAVLNLWLQADPRLKSLAQDEQTQMAYQLMRPSVDTGPGEAQVSWMDWNENEVTPALLAWAKGRMLDHAFEGTSSGHHLARSPRM